MRVATGADMIWLDSAHCRTFFTTISNLGHQEHLPQLVDRAMQRRTVGSAKTKPFQHTYSSRSEHLRQPLRPLDSNWCQAREKTHVHPSHNGSQLRLTQQPPHYIQNQLHRPARLRIPSPQNCKRNLRGVSCHSFCLTQLTKERDWNMLTLLPHPGTGIWPS